MCCYFRSGYDNFLGHRERARLRAHSRKFRLKNRARARNRARLRWLRSESTALSFGHIKNCRVQSYFRSIATILLLSFSHLAAATSIFHGMVTDLSPPYICKLKLTGARGVSLDTKHNYRFSGICSIKIPVGNRWIYQNVWVDTLADWNTQTNEGFETTTLYNNMGTVSVQVKCDDDPWLTKAQCALVGYQNTTQFSNLSGVYNARTGQYPPFEIATGQYPPLARNQAILKEAIAMSIITARQEVNTAHTAFLQTFNNGQTPAPSTTSKP
jgi:hypothetical protein